MTEIRLHKTAPWNSELRRTYREWWTEVDGRYFRISARFLSDDWTVEEIAADGAFIAYVTLIARNLDAAKVAIIAHVDGKSDDQIGDLMLAAPKAGTGRNHPKHVERRQSWK